MASGAAMHALAAAINGLCRVDKIPAAALD